jgi:hypothetical protein
MAPQKPQDERSDSWGCISQTTGVTMATVTSPQSPAAPPPTPPESVPPLYNGDRLTREEFHRRYEAMPPTTQAELIEGVVYMPSPVRYNKHGKQHVDLIGWLSHYIADTPGLEGETTAPSSWT